MQNVRFYQTSLKEYFSVNTNFSYVRNWEVINIIKWISNWRRSPLKLWRFSERRRFHRNEIGIERTRSYGTAWTGRAAQRAVSQWSLFRVYSCVKNIFDFACFSCQRPYVTINFECNAWFLFRYFIWKFSFRNAMSL